MNYPDLFKACIVLVVFLCIFRNVDLTSRYIQVKETPRSKRKSTIVTSRPGASSMLVVALLPVMEEVKDST